MKRAVLAAVETDQAALGQAVMGVEVLEVLGILAAQAGIVDEEQSGRVFEALQRVRVGLDVSAKWMRGIRYAG